MKKLPGGDAGRLQEAKRAILLRAKEAGSVTIADLAERLAMTREGVRLHVAGLVEGGWMRALAAPKTSGKAGRPSRRFRLTAAGEHAFPKAYDALSVELIDALTARGGAKALKEVLSRMTDDRVERWAPRLRGKPLAERVKLLKGLYGEEDPFMDADFTGREPRLIERNCPFLNVASRRPALCSLTVNVLERLLGRRVEREETFQAGHGRCVFRVTRDRPEASGRFRFEGETPSA